MYVLLASYWPIRFSLVGYGCMTCIGNSGPLPEPIVTAIEGGDLVAVGVLSGNRNFEGRINPHTRANYLASPLLCIAYAIAGSVSIDFETEPLGKNYRIADNVVCVCVDCYSCSRINEVQVRVSIGF